jgi:hypothetical protein
MSGHRHEKIVGEKRFFSVSQVYGGAAGTATCIFRLETPSAARRTFVRRFPAA